MEKEFDLIETSLKKQLGLITEILWTLPCREGLIRNAHEGHIQEVHAISFD